MTLESSIAAELRPVIQKNIAQARAALDEVRGLLKVRKASSRPFLVHIESAEAHYRGQLLDPLRFGLDPKAVAQGWDEKSRRAVKDDEADDPELAADADAYVNGLTTNPKPLGEALAGIYAEGYLIGAKEALGFLRDAGNTVSVTGLAVKADAIDWSQWVPGNPGAAAQLAGLDGGAGLGVLLRASDVTIQSIQETRLEQLAGVLADGAKKGESVDAIASRLTELLDDPSRAEMIANTELNRAVTESTLDTYRQNGIEQFDVLVYNPCPICSDEEAANPHDLGDDAPPFHPTCRCAASPHLGNLGEEL